jgi:hypothetical protein
MRLIFLNQDGDRINCGNANELRDISENPRKSSLFFLTVDAKGTSSRGSPYSRFSSGISLESVYPEIGIDGWESALLSEASGAFSLILENRRERIIFLPGRTHNRSRSPR